MSSVTGPAPAFGSADLSNCEREQIHLPGSIQPHGALMVVRAADLTIVQVSDNIERFLGLETDPSGMSLAGFDARLAETVRAASAEDPTDNMPRSLRCRMAGADREFDVAVHRVPDGDLIVAVNGEDFASEQDFFLLYRKSEDYTLTVLRGGRRVDVQVERLDARDPSTLGGSLTPAAR